MTLLGRKYSAVPTSEEAAASPAWSTRYLPKYRPQLQLTKNAVFNICLALASCCLAALAYWKLGFNVHLQFLSLSILGVPMPMRSVGYFVNWGIYGRKFFPWMIPAENLSHILYAFADIRDDGEVFTSDMWADKDIHYANDSWNEPAGNLHGNFKQLFLLKKMHRYLKVLLSIGGWSVTPPKSTVFTAGSTSHALATPAVLRKFNDDTNMSCPDTIFRRGTQVLIENGSGSHVTTSPIHKESKRLSKTI